MIREAFKSINSGAIIISIIMALNFYIPIIPLFCLLILSIIIYFYLRDQFTKRIVLLFLVLILSSLSLLRINRCVNSSYIPLPNTIDLMGDVQVKKDSSRVNKGFICEGVVTKVYNNQFSSQAFFPVTLFSEVYLYQGDIIKNKTLLCNNDYYVCNIYRCDLIEDNTGYFLFRKRSLESLVQKIDSPLLQALLLGKKNRMEPEFVELFRKSGCSHILALSGFHVGVIVILVMTISSLIFNLEISYIVTTLFLVCYVSLTGVTPSLARSIIMFVIGFLFRIKSIRISLLNILVLSFYVSVIIFPQDFFSLSFQLSYIALWGIIVLSKELQMLPGIRMFPVIVKVPVSVSLGAMLSTSYICYPVFGELYPIGLITSLLITPIVTIFIWIGILSFIIPKLDSILNLGEIIIYKVLNCLSRYTPINESSTIFSLLPLILFVIPVILLLLKINRRLNAGRFNTKLKL